MQQAFGAILLVLMTSMPGFAIPVGVVWLNHRRRKNGPRGWIRFLAFAFLVYSFHLTGLGALAMFVWGLSNEPRALSLGGFVLFEIVAVSASYLAVRDDRPEPAREGASPNA